MMPGKMPSSSGSYEEPSWRSDLQRSSTVSQEMPPTPVGKITKQYRRASKLVDWLIPDVSVTDPRGVNDPHIY
jgi:hypothetical protein